MPYTSYLMYQITLECGICHKRLPLPLIVYSERVDIERNQAAQKAGWKIGDGQYICPEHEAK